MGYLLYCIFRKPTAPGLANLKGVDGLPVLTVGDHRLRAATSRIGTQDLVADIPRLLAYERVVEAFHRENTIIPLRYGCVFEDLSQLRRLLQGQGRQYQLVLNELEGCVEMGIRLLIPARSERLSGDPEFRASPAPETTTGRPGGAYLAARRERYASLDRETQAQALIAEKMCQAFAGLYVRRRMESRDLEGERLLSLYFLVPRPSLNRFRQTFQQLCAPPGGKFLLSGPWPPYNFVWSSHLHQNDGRGAAGKEGSDG